MNEPEHCIRSNVFIVDDNPANTMMLQQVVESESFQSVSVFHDSQVALSEFRRLKPNLLLLDLVMPKLSGIEFLKCIESQIKSAEVVVVVLTASHNEQTRLQALSLGAQDYIEKPFNVIETIQRIRNVEYLQQQKNSYAKLSKDLDHKLKKTREDLSDVILTLNAVFRHSSDYVFVTDTNGDIVDCNQAATQRFSIDANAGRNLFSCFDIDDRCILADNPKFVYIDSDHSRVYMETSYSMVKVNHQLHCIFIFKDITSRVEDESNLRFLTETHYITHLPNRHQLTKVVDSKCQMIGMDARLTFIFISFLGNTKEIELHGHERMEYLLLNIALTLVGLSSEFGSGVIHWGDNDFLMIEHSEKAPHLTRMIQQRFSLPIAVSNEADVTIYAKPTLGLYTSERINIIQGNSYNELVHNALLATYEGARYERGLTVFDGDLNDKIKYQAYIEKELIKAIGQQSFNVAYQPKVDLNNGNVVGVEALVRWLHDDLGTIGPNIFVPIAENAGLINDIGAMVLSKVVKDIPLLRNTYSDLKHVALNVAAPQLDQNFIALLQGICDSAGSEMCRFIELEITETSFLDDFDRVKPILRQIKDMGYRLAIDDFGTGYSSLSYLHQLPIDTLKIDRSFVMPICKSQKSLLMVKSIVSMSLALGLDIVAEGIEDKETSEILLSLGVQMGQGYYYYKPTFIY